jgi:hypothetical protein
MGPIEMASPSVANYLTHQLRLCGKTQKQVAAEVGYEKPNIITMMKRGQTKVPLEKVPALARALGVDPVHFLRIAMLEYAPENWRVIEEAFGFVVTRHERELVETVRSATHGSDPRLDTECLDKVGKLITDAVCIPAGPIAAFP